MFRFLLSLGVLLVFDNLYPPQRFKSVFLDVTEESKQHVKADVSRAVKQLDIGEPFKESAAVISILIFGAAPKLEEFGESLSSAHS